MISVSVCLYQRISLNAEPTGFSFNSVAFHSFWAGLQPFWGRVPPPFQEKSPNKTKYITSGLFGKQLILTQIEILAAGGLQWHCRQFKEKETRFYCRMGKFKSSPQSKGISQWELPPSLFFCHFVIDACQEKRKLFIDLYLQKLFSQWEL